MLQCTNTNITNKYLSPNTAAHLWMYMFNRRGTKLKRKIATKNDEAATTTTTITTTASINVKTHNNNKKNKKKRRKKTTQHTCRRRSVRFAVFVKRLRVFYNKNAHVKRVCAQNHVDVFSAVLYVVNKIVGFRYECMGLPSYGFVRYITHCIYIKFQYLLNGTRTASSLIYTINYVYVFKHMDYVIRKLYFSIKYMLTCRRRQPSQLNEMSANEKGTRSTWESRTLRN